MLSFVGNFDDGRVGSNLPWDNLKVIVSFSSEPGISVKGWTELQDVMLRGKKWVRPMIREIVKPVFCPFYFIPPPP